MTNKKFAFLPLLLAITILSNVASAHDGVEHWEEEYTPSQHCDYLADKFGGGEKLETKDTVMELKTKDVSMERIAQIEKVTQIKELVLNLPDTRTEKQEEFRRALLNALSQVEAETTSQKMDLNNLKLLSQNSKDLLECTFNEVAEKSIMSMNEGLTELEKSTHTESDKEGEVTGEALQERVYSKLREKVEAIHGVETQGTKDGTITISFDKSVVVVGLHRTYAKIQLVIDTKARTVSLKKPWWTFATDLNSYSLTAGLNDVVNGNDFTKSGGKKLGEFITTRNEFIKVFEDSIKKNL